MSFPSAQMEQPVNLSMMQVFNMLPTSVQSRMPVIPFTKSLRKSVSLPALPRRSSAPPPYSDAVSTATSSSSHSSASESIFSDAESGITEVSTSTSTAASSIGYKHQPFETSLPTVMEERREQEKRLPRQFSASSFDSTNLRWSPSGIKWRYARQGAHLTGMASEEMVDSSFERRSYIDGVAYFLKACPDNLTELETDIILRSAPWLAERPRPERRVTIRRPSDRGKTFLHRGVQYSVFMMVVLMHAVWCFLLNVARFGAYYERQYNISHHIMARGTFVANAVGKHSVVLSGRISSIGDGRVGQFMSGFAAWTMDSLTSGIQDGFGDGIVKIGRQPRIQLQPWVEN
ncbi:uncharacterized protein BCR38DRAFT_485921 [Pseudomassariella vexata]|uniref:Uncharacterized protein n=1 Tax=Pseudomassariella vexata TaxID=1141098 RepID=A0A1Y2DVJ5_9PEZI|nr:uncharacterized protein BCR38DRAFT_485921 [Pseudomassariella vexata]ORY63156.1 hypothetical protein BCR38DRAFT_485921 [Pseudomassariella vexata]